MICVVTKYVIFKKLLKGTHNHEDCFLWATPSTSHLATFVQSKNPKQTSHVFEFSVNL